MQEFYEAAERLLQVKIINMLKKENLIKFLININNSNG